jgi:THUMP domain-containing protein/RNA cap guanine-N2 methyltransferase
MAMDLATFTELLSAKGQVALTDAAALAPSEATFLGCFEKLRKHHQPALAKAALETVLLRERAHVKFANADRMYFTREALEQATGEVAARHRAGRFAPYGFVADLCCGIGGDTLALAASGLTVHAVESDSLRLAMALANAQAAGVSERITFHEGDALTVSLPEVRAAFADPARRARARRHLDPEEYTPPLSALRDRFGADFPLAVKIAPGVAWEDIAACDAEVEFVSVEGELKECVLWLGPFRTKARRATLLPSGVTLAADEPPVMPPVAAVRGFVFDPDPAVVRAGLLGQVAVELGLLPIDHTVMLITGDEPVVSPFVTNYRVELAAKYHFATLQEHLRARGVGRVTPVKRGSTIDSERLLAKLKLAGREHRVVILTRAAGEQSFIVCERLTASSPSPTTSSGRSTSRPGR